ncbi:MAG: hypothetical protein HC895_17655, partial [Leptolyngbyaceae cyanobacterium SM1_3_5]|nr:hypothetical protein [Leptolyngbyaceae cyanobacterium SM1_3_5]
VQAWAKSGRRGSWRVGDIVPLLFAWMSGAPYAFVGTAKSEYYLRDEVGLLPRPTWFERMESWSGSVYLPWERWLMTRSRCRAVFPRDSLTTQVLRQWPIPAFDLGNPMMDGLDLPVSAAQFFGSEPERDGLTFVLLPGSRPPEAYQNWDRILVAVQALIDARLEGRSLLFLAAIAPQLDLAPLTAALIVQGWRQTEQGFTQGKATIALSQTNYRDCLYEADFAIAMAGTATEQFVGLGKPALTIAGAGPQFTPKFAEAQTRLLGASAILLKEPRQAPQIVRSILQDPDRLHLIAENGRRRLGASGAADRIAECLLDRLS